MKRGKCPGCRRSIAYRLVRRGQGAMMPPISYRAFVRHKTKPGGLWCIVKMHRVTRHVVVL